MTRVSAGWLARGWKPALVILQLAKMVYWFRNVELASGLPLVNVDYIQFYGRVLRMHAFFRESGRMWGYDPFEMAGYIAGPFHEVGTHILALLTYALAPLVPVERSMLVAELAGLTLVPFLAFPVLRTLGFRRRTAWIGFGLLVFTFGVCEPFSVLMIKMGLWGFMIAGASSLLLVALLYRWLERRGPAAWAALTACSCAVFQVHPTALVVVIVPMAALYVFYARRLGWRGHLALAGTAGLVAATNWYWMSPFLAFSHWRVSAPYYETAGLADVLTRFGPVQDSVFGSLQALVNVSAVVLSAVAIGRLATTRRALARTLALWIVSLFVICYFGSGLPVVRTLQPGRNEYVLMMLLYLLSATVFESHVLAARRARWVTAALAPLFVLFMFEIFPGFRPWWVTMPALTTKLPGWQRDFINVIAERAGKGGALPEGRLLLESADDLKPNFSEVVPAMTGAVLLGGPHAGNFLLPRSSLFTGNWVAGARLYSFAPMAFGRELTPAGEPFFAEHLILYNVALVAARTPQMIAVLDRMTHTLEPIADIPPQRLYAVRARSHWFHAGSGRLALAYDKVTVDHASPGIIVPRVHWFDTFTAEPPVPIKPVFLMDDPTPFLSIDNSAGHARIEIRNGGLPPMSLRLRRWLAGEKPW